MNPMKHAGASSVWLATTLLVGVLLGLSVTFLAANLHCSTGCRRPDASLQALSDMADLKSVVEESVARGVSRAATNPSRMIGPMPDDARVPHRVMSALVHYAASKRTPQQTHPQIGITLELLKERGPCNLLVFGLGYDSVMWAALNHGGRTVFLEHNPQWMEMQRAEFPWLEMVLVDYNTLLKDSDDLLKYSRKTELTECSPHQDLRTSNCRLALTSLPSSIYETDWDIIMVDAPWGDPGLGPKPPGRMGAIYSSAVLARNRQKPAAVDVLVHDYTRKVEFQFAQEFLCPENRIVVTEGILAHYRIQPQKLHSGSTFCRKLA